MKKQFNFSLILFTSFLISLVSCAKQNIAKDQSSNPILISSAISSDASAGKPIIEPKAFPYVLQEYVYDEYYSSNDNAYIRLYENSYFQFDSENYSFFARYSKKDDILLVNYSYYEDASKEDSIALTDFIYLTKQDNKIIINSDLSFYEGGFSFVNTEYVLKGSNINNGAYYRYSKETADKLTIKFSMLSKMILA